MQKSKDVRSPSSAPASQNLLNVEEQKTKSTAARAQSKNDSWENCDHLLDEAIKMQENKDKLNERGEKTDNIV